MHRGPMLVVIDYRPALRTRTGVGEYVHEVSRALATLQEDLPSRDTLTLFTSSWKDRVSPSLVACTASVHRV